jgi:heavy metal translocating P-type ATPase
VDTTAPTCKLCGEPVEQTAEGAFCSVGCRTVADTLGVEKPVPAEPVVEDPPPESAVRTYLHVDGMYGPTCEAFLESVGADCEGVSAVTASYVTETIRIDHDPAIISESALCDRLSGVGYTVVPLTTGGDTERDRTDRRGTEQAGTRGRTERSIDEMLGFRYVAGVVFGTFMLLPYVVVLYPVYFATALGGSIGPFDSVTGVSDTALMLPLFAGVTGVVLFFTGVPVLRGAYVSIKTRRPTTDLLVTITIVAAYASGVVALAVGRIDVYFDLTIVIAASVVAAIFYESLLKRRAVSRLTDLTVSQVGEARLARPDGATETVPVEAVEPDDRLLVSPGERVPVDGTLVDGECTVEEAVVTGESLPVHKETGDDLVGGSVVTEGQAVVEAGETATSSIDRLTEAVWDLQSATHGLQRRVDRLSGRLIPLVLLGAVGAGTLAVARGGGPIAVFLAVTGGVIALSPWGLGLSTPLSVATNIREALDAGVVVFDETVFQRVRDTDVVVFDKTGTLTTGTMEVLSADLPPDLLRAAAAIEARTTHPAAAAIADAFGDEAADTFGDEAADAAQADGGETATASRVTEFESYATGVRGTVDGTPVLVGHPSLFEEQGWTLPADIEREANTHRDRSRLPVVVGREGEAEGLVVLGDEPRAAWDRTLDELADRGVDAVVLTGDDSASAAQFRDHPAVTHVFPGVPPTGKTATVRALQDEGEHVTMVGDGTNDAPALAQADLGVSLGSGTALASDAADVALAEDDLAAVETVFDLASAAQRRVRQNTVLALSYNAIVIPFLLAGHLSPLVTTAGVLVSGGLLGVNVLRGLNTNA